MIAITDLWKTYPLGKTQVDAIKGLCLDFARGDFAAIAGPSGSGKTTLMNIIGLIDSPSRGSVMIDGRETVGLNRGERTKMRQELIGFVFQSFNLLPVLSVFENVELPLVISRTGFSSAERRKRVDYLLEEVGLSERRNHKPAELSGGQQQRAAIARALVTRPRIVLADEPTANLDSGNGERILELMKKINIEEGTTFVFSTHDPDIWAMASHIIFLKDGCLESREHRLGTEKAGEHGEKNDLALNH